MNTRLQQFISAENITQSQFADTIGVARASISHIIAGRNKPGFDFIENMARHFPALNLEWLITGKGRMYKDTADSSSKMDKTDVDLFKEPVNSIEVLATEKSADVTEEPKILEKTFKDDRTADSHAGKNTRKISRIMVFYDDNTFEEFK